MPDVPMTLGRDTLRYLGQVCDWLDSCPDGKFEYGEFYLGRIPVYLDRDVVATFVNDDPDWLVELA